MTRYSYKHFEMSPRRKMGVKPPPLKNVQTRVGGKLHRNAVAVPGKVNEKCLNPDRISGTMKDGLLTDRQMEVLRYRKQGLTQQQIADIISTSKANVCTIEKSAMENIRRAKETLEFLYTLDATQLCTVPTGTDLFEVPSIVFREAEKINIKVKYDTISLINRLRESKSQCCKARQVCEDIVVYITDQGEIYFG
jgi:Tfx family DNA-binding protein